MPEKTEADLLKADFLNLQPTPEQQCFRLEGQEAMQLFMQAGDRLTLHSVDGLQTSEILVLDQAGNNAPELLSDAATSVASGMMLQLEGRGRSARRLKQQLHEWGITLSQLTHALIIAANDETVLEAKADIQLVVAAAGADMAMDEHQPVTEINLSLIAATTQSEYLPQPLAPVKSEFRIAKASARCYPVKAGEWIQIIDVAGKQCSDFLAFDQAALTHGRELGLDASATRTITGLSNPQPGIYSRFYDADMQPMVEVVQDTVGRHDSFLMACSPKYYDDSGYFGHISCSDNFNRELAQHGITARTAWPAINFFFNTGIEPCGTVFMDEPWSRAGDYVLLRANRDLLCASSACPDDIDPANGWNPTDIHIRIYAAEQQFPRAYAQRILPQELPRMTKTTGFYRPVSELTNHLSEYQGYWVASEYDGWGARAEYLACRERVAMIDLSPLRKFEITGPDAEALLQYSLTRNVKRLAVGEIAYSAVCNDTGGMIDDGTIFRMGEQAFRWVCGDPYTGHWLREQAAKQGFRVSVRNSSEQLHNVALQGPQSRNLLRQILWTPECQPTLDNLAWFHFLTGRLGGPEGIPVMVSRTGYTGELGFEIWCHPDVAETVWQTLWDTGQQYDIAPMGFDALDMLRIEAGLIFADHEFCPETNPFEAGIGFTVPLKTKPDDFIGREAIARQAPQSRKKLMGLLIDGGDAAAHGDLVYQGRFPVGVVTSATPSPLMGQHIALCRLAPDFAAPGTRLEIGKLDGLQKRLAAEVTTLPFYDPERTRVRS